MPVQSLCPTRHTAGCHGIIPAQVKVPEWVVGTCDQSGEISKPGLHGIRNDVPANNHVRIPWVIRLLVPQFCNRIWKAEWLY